MPVGGGEISPIRLPETVFCSGNIKYFGFGMNTRYNGGCLSYVTCQND